MKKFFLEILTPEKVFFKGEVEQITVTAPDGQVSVLSMHQPTVMAIDPGLIKIYQGGAVKEAYAGDGFIEVCPDETIVLVQAVEWPEDIDELKALEAKERAEEMLRRKTSLSDYKMSKAALQRAFARLKVKSRYNKKI